MKTLMFSVKDRRERKIMKRKRLLITLIVLIVTVLLILAARAPLTQATEIDQAKTMLSSWNVAASTPGLLGLDDTIHDEGIASEIVLSHELAVAK